MPTIAFKSRIRTVSDNCTLDLIVSHRLVAGEPSAAPQVVKNLPSNGLDIVLVSPLTITTTGMLNNRRISAEGLMISRIAQHLLEYLKLNSNELGFEAISDAHIAKDTGRLTFFCTASRPSWPLEVQLPHLQLLGFDIDYSWHETLSSSSPETSGLLDSVLTPFSSRLTLPYATALNNAVERFVKFQMIKHYPRIFGSWIQQLDMEKPYISSVFASLSNILRRSSNPAFQESCQMQLEMLKKAMLTSLADSESRLSGYLESSGSFNANKCQRALLDAEETVFMHAVEHIYCVAMKRPRFKSISTSQNWLYAADDIFCDQQSLSVGFEEEPHFGVSDEEGGSLYAQVCPRDRSRRVQTSEYRLTIDHNICLGQYGRTADDGGNVVPTSLAEDLFASDSDLLDTQLKTDHFLRTPGSSSDERHNSFHPDFSPNLGSLSAARDPDYMTLNVNAPDSALSSFSAFIYPTSSCTEGYRYHLVSESQVQPLSSDVPTHQSHDVSLSQDIPGRTFVAEGKCDRFRQIIEEPPKPLSFALADTVSDWDSDSFNSNVDFVAMEF